MNDQHPIGTVCIGQHFVTHPHRNGMQCEVTHPLQWVSAYNAVLRRDVVGLQYGVRWVDGDTCWCLKSHLKRPSEPPKHKEWADEAVRKLKKQSSDHVAGGSKNLIPEEA